MILETRSRESEYGASPAIGDSGLQGGLGEALPRTCVGYFPTLNDTCNGEIRIEDLPPKSLRRSLNVV